MSTIICSCSSSSITFFGPRIWATDVVRIRPVKPSFDLSSLIRLIHTFILAQLALLFVPKHEALMRIFRDLEMVEYLGSGIPRILEAYSKETLVFRD
ncbi:MAG: hypothetical protein ACI9FZ_000337 [Bacteroidia bacterium]|jgi:hypothetical protein